MSNYLIQDTTLTGIADAIRAKTGGTDQIAVTSMATEIEGITTGFPNGTEWTPSTITSKLYDVKRVDGVWYAFCSTANARCYKSIDGVTWMTWFINTNGLDIIHLGGMWIGYSISSGLWYLDDDTWVLSNLNNTNYTISSMAQPSYVGGKWFVHTSTLWYSSNGREWIDTSYTGTSGSVIYAFGKWFTVLNTTGDAISYSTDLVTWTKIDNDVSLMTELIVFNGVAVTCGDGGLYYSTDGLEWIDSGCDDEFNCLKSCGDLLFAYAYSGGDTVMRYSKDGITWSPCELPSASVTSLVYAEGKFVCSTYSGGCYYSTDGITWLQSNLTERGSSVCGYSNGVWIATHSSGVYYSFDGISWTMADTGGIPLYRVTNQGGIWFGTNSTNGLYYSVGWKPTM